MYRESAIGEVVIYLYSLPEAVQLLLGVVEPETMSELAMSQFPLDRNPQRLRRLSGLLRMLVEGTSLPSGCRPCEQWRLLGRLLLPSGSPPCEKKRLLKGPFLPLGSCLLVERSLVGGCRRGRFPRWSSKMTGEVMLSVGNQRDGKKGLIAL